MLKFSISTTYLAKEGMHQISYCITDEKGKRRTVKHELSPYKMEKLGIRKTILDSINIVDKLVNGEL